MYDETAGPPLLGGPAAFRVAAYFLVAALTLTFSSVVEAA